MLERHAQVPVGRVFRPEEVCSKDARRTASEHLRSQGTHTMHVPVAPDMCCCSVDTVRFLVTHVLPINERWCI